MESKFYTITKEAEYDAMDERLNLLAEALVNVHPGANFLNIKSRKNPKREVLQFLKRFK
ncbi:hypothetical protein [Adhaeribacter pallidiroseus]|uniref:Uncharacterized protein n=1 Tax=Adhaeribacter pallidiroseus TaxID=2072847 RepID=A0A369QFQ3_9BACT|nr:hypothetical protein [Adhaeribacter pallidiroseus]RDC62097.1 hypothetical protein AHMF7616_00688 [Adhaeribacter pallidiroseus]